MTTEEYGRTGLTLFGEDFRKDTKELDHYTAAYNHAKSQPNVDPIYLQSLGETVEQLSNLQSLDPAKEALSFMQELDKSTLAIIFRDSDVIA